MADDIVEQLTWLRDEFYDVDSVTSIVDLAMTEVNRLRAAGDALAEALSAWIDGMDAFTDDAERLRAWREARRG